jgi:serine/threonine protein kinase
LTLNPGTPRFFPFIYHSTLSASNDETGAIPPSQQILDGVQDPLIGKTIGGGRYRILDLIGRGGMSVVYKARQELVERIVAVKTLKMQLLNEPVIKARFEREVKTLSKLNHPNIVTVFDCIVEAGQPYLVMDCLSGRSLQEVLKEEAPLTPYRVQCLFLQVLAALEHAQKYGIAHRDIKPGNIMIELKDDEERVKVVDFGLAHLGSDSQRLTQTGEVWGSPFYLSPEQATGTETDPRCDIYSLGIVMYECLAGCPPFMGKTAVETVRMHLELDPLAIKTMNGTVDVPAQLESIVFKAIRKEPAERYQSAAEMKEALVKLVLPRPAGMAKKTSRPTPSRTTHNMSRLGKKKSKGLSPFVTPFIAFLLVVQAALFFFKELMPARNVLHAGTKVMSPEWSASTKMPQSKGYTPTPPPPNISAPSGVPPKVESPAAPGPEKEPPIETTAHPKAVHTVPWHHNHPANPPKHQEPHHASPEPHRAPPAGSKHSSGSSWDTLKQKYSADYLKQ